MRGRLRRALDLLFKLEDTPHRTALSFGIGVWIAFFPILGTHTGMALAIAFLFRLGRVPILLGAYINNPWTLAPLYLAGTLVGCALLGVSTEGLARVDWGLDGRAFYRAMLAGLRPYLWPFFLGNTLLGLAGGTVGYLGLRSALEARGGSAPSG